MAARKLQQEIDKVIKKVKEGTAEFDYLYEKLITTENTSQKEKLEGDLKKEIKKLQRSRDQIKTWLSGNEVKDKTQLQDMRKEIEVDMEKFKDVEKEMKTKAFSKQGLNMQQKLDPREREKVETASFLQGMIEEIELQSEGLEARVDSLSNSKRKLTSKKQEELKETQEKLDRNNYHQTQLETLLRLLENGDLETEDIQDMREDIEYYVKHNQEDLFVDDDAMYEQLGLDSKEEFFAALEAKEEARNSTPPPTAAPEPSPPPAVKESKRVASGSVAKPALHVSTSTTSVNNVSSTATTPLKTTPTPKVKYASLIAATQAERAQQLPQSAQEQVAKGTNGATTNSVSGAPQPLSSLSSGPPPGLPGLTRVATNTTQTSSITREGTQSPQLAGTPRTLKSTLESMTAQLEKHESIKEFLPALEEGYRRIETPASLESIAEILKSSLLTCPDSFDADKRKMYHSDAPTRTFVYYPQEPLIQLTNNTKNLSLYDDSTLFYIFYHHRQRRINVPYLTTYGTHLQNSAAKELSGRGWLYNVAEQKWYKKSDADSWSAFDSQSDWVSKKVDSLDLDPNNIWKST